MNTLPIPDLREEWTDADFDFPEGEPLQTGDHDFGKHDDPDEDWDLEMNLGKTGGAKVQAVIHGLAQRSAVSRGGSSGLITIKPPVIAINDDDDDEGGSTIKLSLFPKSPVKEAACVHVEEDLEDAFALPDDLTQLSLAPLTLSHRPSKFFEWGDKDHSSQSSDACSSLGFAASPSSNSGFSLSLPTSETEEDEDDMEGLVIPTGLFESGGKELAKILEEKKKALPIDNRAKVASPDPEDDFEIGLIIDDDISLSPSRLRLNTNHHYPISRSESLPAPSNPIPRPSSRSKYNRARSPPVSSARQLERLQISPSPPLRPIRSQTFQPLASPASYSSAVKSGSLRSQKSQSGLKPSPPPSLRKSSRKASLQSLTAGSQSQDSRTSPGSGVHFPRYDKPTAASRAKTHSSSGSKILAWDFVVPPTRPSTPSSNTAALRLTMPTTSRLKSRPSLPAGFGPASRSSPLNSLPPSSPPSQMSRSTSLQTATPQRLLPSPLTPPDARARPIHQPRNPPPPAPTMLRRPTRPRLYGDGTELDAIADLPTDREKERRYRVQPKATGNRVAGGTYAKVVEHGTVQTREQQVVSGGGLDPNSGPASSLSKQPEQRAEFPELPASSPVIETYPKKKTSSRSSQTRKKPTLIRNLNGPGAPKVIGDMKWNPKTLRWEGNEQVLRDFDAALGTSTRPALITHLTGSSGGSVVAGVRKVGNMIFDPTQMCWISTLPPEEDEPDVFANLADDEEDDGWLSKGGTIRAGHSPGFGGPGPDPTLSTGSSGSIRMEESRPNHHHTRTISESSSDRGSRPSMICDVDDDFLERCRQAERRHRVEMVGWEPRHSSSRAPDRSSLYDIRSVANQRKP